MTEPLIDIDNVSHRFGDQWVHKDLSLSVYPGEILAIIGGSGSGKTTLLKSLLMLQKPSSGTIKMFGQDLSKLSVEQISRLRRRFGMLFQHGALFSAMTVLENILFPMQAFTSLPISFLQPLAMLKLALVGLPEDASVKYPSELSGGMQRRAAAARALAMDPELLFLDEPTTGLDPRSARLFDELVLFLRDTLKLTVVMITHDLASLERVADRVAFIGDGKILAVAPFATLVDNPDPHIVDYFSKVC